MAGDVQTAPRPAQRRVARKYWGYPMPTLLSPAPTEERMVPAEPLAAPTASDVHRARPGNDADLNPSSLERQVTMSTRRAARFTAFAETHNVGPEALDQLRDDVGGLANDYLREPLISIMGDLVETQEIVFRLLEGKQKPVQTRDLYLLAGLVSGMLSKASHDLGRPHDAMTQARTLYVCADNADHQGLRAWARGLQSLIAYWAGRPHEAIRYAQAGAELAANQTGSVAAWLPSLEARAWALLTAPDEAVGAIGRAADRSTRHQPDDLDRIGGLLTFPLAKQHYYAAGTYVFLDGEHAKAQREATAAIELYETGHPQHRSYSDLAGAQAELALSRVTEGELDGAREALAPVLDLEPERRIGGIVASAARVHDALRTRTYAASPAARGLREQIEAFCQVPAAALPAS
jgi:tetratricopeptide (TPR) repeat protein